MADRYLMPIPLPRGRKPGDPTKGLLSVYLAPRLLTTTQLANYPDWSNWATVSNGLTFGVEVNGAPLPGPSVTRTSSANPAAWTATFAPQTPVRAYQTVDRRNVALRSVPLVSLTSAMSEAYGGIFASFPDRPPTGRQLLQQPAPAGLLSTDPAKSDVPAARTFTEPTSTDVSTAGQAPDWDFQQVLSALGHHPHLLRVLGVVVDFELALPSGAPTAVQVTTNWSTAFAPGLREEIPVVMPTTPDFLPLPDPDPDRNTLVDGWLKLAGLYSLTTPNALAGAQALTSLVANLDQDAPTPLPALDTRGITLARDGLDTQLLQRFQREWEIDQRVRALANGAAGALDLYAEDVTIGYRVDVHDETAGTWRSVFERSLVGTYSFPRNGALSIAPPGPDESWTTRTLTTEGNETWQRVGEDVLRPRETYRVNQSVFTWTGWSAAAPPPGSATDTEAAAAVPTPPSAPLPGDDVQVGASYQARPGSLPRLRYGRTYKMRARSVDLAGNSLPTATGDVHPSQAESETCTFGRLAPVPSPVVVRRSARPTPGVGDTSHTIVLKSDYDVPDDQVTPVDRLLFPPRTTQQLCELHGVPLGGVQATGPQQIAAYQGLAAREPLGIEDQTAVDPATGELVAGTLAGGTVQPGPPFPAAGYLVDPAASGIAFRGAPGGDAVVPLSGNWPAREAVYLLVSAGSAAPVVKTTPGSAVGLFVPKAAQVLVDVASAIEPSLVDAFAHFAGADAATQAALRSRVESGGHWMTSGRTSILLVHAVRRPLAVPTATALTATRPGQGSLDVVVGGTVALDRPSTDTLRLTARFTDPIDALDQPAPTGVTSSVVLGSVPVPLDGSPTVFPFSGLQASLRDTKRHLLRVKLEAFSRFSRYFTEELSVTFAADVQQLSALGVVGPSVALTNPATGDAYVKGTDYRVQPRQGTVTRVASGAIPAGATVTARFVPLPTSRLSTEGPGRLFDVTVPNSQVPATPVVESVLPAFAATRRARGGRVLSIRNGRVLRVLLERPWFTTGLDERLGVVLDSLPDAVPTTTRWGRDPVVAGPAPAWSPFVEDFPRARETALAIDGSHDVAGHEVVYDEARQRWYADVEVGGDIGYRPFVQLTVARYQPESLPGTHLSQLVTCDPIRLGPSRTVLVSRRGRQLRVIVRGQEHLGVPDETAGRVLRFNRVQVSVQTALQGVSDPDLKWQTTGTPVELRRRGRAGNTTWSGSVTPPRGRAVRLLIEELEPSMRDVNGTATLAYEVVFVETIEP